MDEPAPDKRMIKRPRPLFIMGNKRSGTSVLVSLLNIHPKVFITHESDIIWILYQAHKDPLFQPSCYPWDGPLGMKATLEVCNDIFNSMLKKSPTQEEIKEAFYEAEAYLMFHGSAIQGPVNRNDLSWIGDKKPVQHCDPQIRPFMRTHFPDARYVHIVRNPKAVVASMNKASKEWKTGVPEYWKNEPREIMERWAIHEDWVLRAKSQGRETIHTLRHEDLCREPVEKMAEIFKFLEVDTPGNIRDLLRGSIEPDPNDKYDSFNVPVSKRAARIMKIYGYRPD
jgi:sulfotransferase family protein